MLIRTRWKLVISQFQISPSVSAISALRNTSRRGLMTVNQGINEMTDQNDARKMQIAKHL